MNRNTELHFGQIPQIDHKRSKFEMSHSHKFTMNAADIVPIYTDLDITPGDTVQMDIATLIRMATPIYPVMDNAYVDVYFFFVPNRLLWDHWAAFWGENEDPWTQQTEYEIPMIQAPEGGWTEGTLADYMGIPTKVDGIEVNSFGFKAYAKIYNDWFRDENLLSNCHIYTDDSTRQGMNGTEENYDPVIGTELGGAPMKAAKFHDMLTSALPTPQKGEPVQIPLGTTAGVYSGQTNYINIGDTSYPTEWARLSSQNKVIEPTGGYAEPKYYNLRARYQEDKKTYYTAGDANDRIETDSQIKMAPTNLYADLANATAATISSLRQAFALQKFFEASARGGTRYIEFLRNIFGVTSSDARLQRAEYLGGTRIPINMDQILQTSATSEISPQGNTAGFSCTIDHESLFTKSFEEHGVLMGLATIRTDHTYQQGLEKMWTRRKWVDYYNPYFANLSEQAILNENIYAQGTDEDKEAFGYQEAWAEYRYKNNYLSGYMRSNATGSLDVWHYADDYAELPRLSGEWIQETKTNVDRTIAVSSQITHQFIADFFFKTYYTRPMPVYSVPGLIDHV